MVRVPWPCYIALVNNNETEILDAICCTSSQWSALCIDAINTYHGRSYLPVIHDRLSTTQLENGQHKSDRLVCDKQDLGLMAIHE